MQQTLDGLRSGLGLAIVAIFLLLAAYFQSLRSRSSWSARSPP